MNIKKQTLDNYKVEERTDCRSINDAYESGVEYGIRIALEAARHIPEAFSSSYEDILNSPIMDKTIVDKYAEYKKRVKVGDIVLDDGVIYLVTRIIYADTSCSDKEEIEYYECVSGNDFSVNQVTKFGSKVEKLEVNTGALNRLIEYFSNLC